EDESGIDGGTTPRWLFPERQGDEIPREMQILMRGIHLEDQRQQESSVTAKRYVLGIHCAVAPASVRRHLKLGDSGLEILTVVPDSAAASAGLQKNDLLLRLNGMPLAGVTELMKAVRDSEGKPLTLDLLRDGERIQIEVTPTLRAIEDDADQSINENSGAAGSPDGSGFVVHPFADSRRLLMQRIYPGILLDNKASKDRIQELMKQLQQEHAGKVGDQESGLPDADAPATAQRELQDTLAKLQRQITEIQQQQASLLQQLLELQKAHDGDKGDQ
ncbi:MAG: PDZ domain-containing protein, partial [Planctomycetaceae bacterium]|nr:PDZ domain-containing protein [Planctomycetaceae bacterium]